MAAAGVVCAQEVDINCGGSAYTGTDGTSWSADQYYSGGDLLYSSNSISNTSDLPLYRAARAGLYGDFSYTIPIANGSYNLSLLFAEIQYTNPGDRVFNVLVNGSPVLTNFDILAQAGTNTALTKTFPVTVTTGAVQISVVGVTRRGILNGIRVVSTTSSGGGTTPPPTTTGAPLVSINCGGTAMTGLDGTAWSADQYYSGGDLAYTSYSITGTSDLFLYRTARRGLYGNFSYSIPLANGSYVLKLKFAEVIYSDKGQRVFNVNVNGTPVLSNFDIVADAGTLTADDKQFPVTVTNGTLQIDVLGVTGFGILNGIQVLPASGTTGPPTPTLSLSTSALSFAGTAGAANPSAQTATVSTTAAWTAASNAAWLTVSPTSGTGNGSLSVAANLAGMAAGTYPATVTVTAPGATGSPQTIAVTLVVTAAAVPPGVSASPTSLNFSATAGGSNPAAQAITISNSGGGTLNWSAAKTQPWLVLLATGGTGASVLSVQAVTGSLAAGTYTDTVTISAAGANPASKTVAVTFSVAPAVVTPPAGTSIVSINCGGSAMTGADGTNWAADQYFTGGDLLYTGYLVSGTQDLYLYRSARRGLYGNFSYTIPVANGSYNLKLRFAELAYGSKGQRVFNVNVNGSPVLTNFDIVADAGPLTADDKVFPVTVSNGTLQIDVIGVVGFGLLNGIQVLPAGSGTTTPTLTVSASSAAFIGTAGAANPAAQSIAVSTTQGWTAASNQSWLTVSPASGTGSGTLSIGANLAGLAAGSYSGAITVTSPGATGSPQTVNVTLAVSAASLPPALSVSPTSLSFGAAAGASNPATQSVAISNTGAGTLNWTAAKTQSWLSLSTTSGSGAGSISVQPAVGSLAAGTYTDTVSISAPGATPSSATVAVSFTVTAAAPSITSFTATQTSITAGQSVTLSWGTANGTSESIDQGVGAVAASGSTTVSPAATTTYTLTATNAAGTATGAITISVGSATPPPTSGNSANTDQWQANSNPPQTYDPNGGQVLYNGIQLPAAWPPVHGATQTYAQPPYIQNPPSVIPIDTGRQLFVDDFLIGYTNLTRSQHQAVMYPGNPVMSPGSGWDTMGNAFPFSDGAWFDPADQKYKIWYFGGQQGNEMCYAYSTDGVNWIKPAISDAAVPNTNVVLTIWGGRDTTTVWMDLHDTPARKFKAFVTYSNGPAGSYVLNIFFSPDGIHWTGPQAVTPAALSDRTTAFYNPFRGVWVDSARNPADYPAAPTRAAYHSERERWYSESKDLQVWTPSDPSTAYWTGTDERDPYYPSTTTIPQLYNLDAVPYESLMVGMFSWYYPTVPDLVELGVGFSRDGFNWVRPTRGGGPNNAFIPAANLPNTWNGYNTQSAGGAFMVINDQLYFYFSGRNYPHGQDASSTRQTGLAKLRRDGFYSMDAGSSQGILTTRPVKFSGSHLFVNVVDPSGQLQAEVLDANGNVIPAFAKGNSAVITADTTRTEVTWSGASLGSLAGQTVSFRFYLTNGSLYSFWVAAATSGASNGYVGANGPGFTTDTDTVGNGGSGSGSTGTTAAPVLSPAGGTFGGSVTVAMTSATSGASIHYTTDGSAPTISSTLYSAPITLTASATVNAMAFAAGLTNSSITLGIFTVTAQAAPPALGFLSPSGTLPYGTTSVTLGARSNTVATCRYSTTANTAYSAMAGVFTTADGYNQSATVNGLASGAAYNYYVRCQDNSGNVDTTDVVISFAIAPASFTPFYQYFEAEAGAVSGLTVASDAAASGGLYVTTSTANTGSDTFTVTLPAAGSYYIWGKILAVDGNSDSWFVSADGGPTDVYDDAQSYGSFWQWTVVNGRGTSGTPFTLNPRVFTLGAGTHTITFGGRELGAKLDQILVTNDPAFVPTK
jgi:Malectin domain/Chitobiase/beta-hexosaminidase C-terminal domain/Viral BACON domain